MHKYIDINKVEDFSKKKGFYDIKKDITEKYHITNIKEDTVFNEYLTYICDALYTDYDRKIANYEAYIEEGMNARMLMELQKSAVIPINEKFDYFYAQHNDCETIEDVIDRRVELIRIFNEEYQNLDWQYYFLIKHTLAKDSIGFRFDFEECYADGDWRLQTCVDDYVKGFVDAHTCWVDW